MPTKERITISLPAEVKALLDQVVPASQRSSFCADVIEKGIKEKQRLEAIARLGNLQGEKSKTGKTILKTLRESDEQWIKKFDRS